MYDALSAKDGIFSSISTTVQNENPNDGASTTKTNTTSNGNLSLRKDDLMSDMPTSTLRKRDEELQEERLMVSEAPSQLLYYLKRCNIEGALQLASNSLGATPQERKIVKENGRLYLGQAVNTYMLPCDEGEEDRLDFLHTVFMAALSPPELIHVPHSPNGRFLDLGCGTGLWTIEVAKAYPKAFVVGADICAIQPGLHPSNCLFVTPFDFELPWLIGEHEWDVINLRMGCGSVVNWPMLYQRIFGHLRVGGWFQQLEINFEPCYSSQSLEETPLKLWYELLKTATEESKRKIEHSATETQKWLREAGFSDISHEQVMLPLNQWSPNICRRVSRRYKAAFSDSIEPLCLAPFSRVFGWSQVEIQPLVMAAKREVLDQDRDVYHTLNLYRARKAA
ncbi:S-adenosyl-L-methionine-dependent methyltransferase [Aspergillus floccosus]